MEIYMACISTDLRKQNGSILILSITVAFRLVFCQIHVMPSKVNVAYLISISQRFRRQLLSASMCAGGLVSAQREADEADKLSAHFHLHKSCSGYEKN